MADQVRKRLNWEWNEIVLACELVIQNGGRSLDHEDPRVVELSELLQRMTVHPLEKRLPEFRNPNGVAQKTRNIAQHHPGYTGRPSNGNGLDGKVMEQFLAEPDVMHAAAESIRKSVADGEPVADPTADELATRITKLQVNRSSGRPALYQPITLLWAIGRAYRGAPRMVSWKETQPPVLKLLERYGRQGERPRADYPVAALHHAGLWEVANGAGQVPNAHGDTELSRWFDVHHPRSGLVPGVYELVRNRGEARVAAVGAILETFFADMDYVELLEEVGLSETGIAAELGDADDDALSDSPLEEAYRRLCGIATKGRAQREGRRVTRTTSNPVRSAAARLAVLKRSGGRCENPSCTGQLSDVTDSGDPILEVDHLQDLALGGPDDPAQMIALCPNCHAIKTRGRTRGELRDALFVVAKRRHKALITAEQSRP